MWFLALVPLVGLICCECWLFQGLILRRRVTGGSMACCLLGKHARGTCDDCDFSWPFDAQEAPGIDELICPNCGWNQELSAGQPIHRGDRLLVNAWSLWQQPPRRWDVLAIRTPDKQARLAVKRVVGLPQEQLTIVDGDVLVDGKIARKSGIEMRKMAILVHDARYAPAHSSSPVDRWQGRTQSGWNNPFGQYLWTRPAQHTPVELLLTESLESQPAWLTYQHLGSATPLRRRRPTAITDNYGFNQHVSRILHAVRDVFLTCRVQAAGRGWLGFRCHDGYRQHFVLWCPDDGRVQVRIGNRPPLSRQVNQLQSSAVIDVQFGTWDQQLMLCANRETLVQETLERGDAELEPVDRPLAILPIAWDRLEVTDLNVWRDVYYLAPADWPRESGRQLGEQEYFVLGDNSPISIDSRHWSKPHEKLTSDHLVGRVD